MLLSSNIFLYTSFFGDGGIAASPAATGLPHFVHRGGGLSAETGTSGGVTSSMSHICAVSSDIGITAIIIGAKNGINNHLLRKNPQICLTLKPKQCILILEKKKRFRVFLLSETDNSTAIL